MNHIGCLKLLGFLKGNATVYGDTEKLISRKNRQNRNIVCPFPFRDYLTRWVNSEFWFYFASAKASSSPVPINVHVYHARNWGIKSSGLKYIARLENLSFTVIIAHEYNEVGAWQRPFEMVPLLRLLTSQPPKAL